jgi:hypothetical protein
MSSSNKTRKSPSPKSSPGSKKSSPGSKKSSPGSKKSSPGSNKSRKSSPSISPNEDLEELKKERLKKMKKKAFNIILQKNPTSLETLLLFSTNSKYKKDFFDYTEISNIKIGKLDVKIETLENKINKLEDFAYENHEKLIVLEQRLGEVDNVEPMEKSIKKEINRIKNEIKAISEKNKKAHDDIEKYELMIEDTIFIREIWVSKKIDDETKQKLTNDYNSFIKANQSKIDKIQRDIEINKEKSFEKKYPNTEPIVIESPDQIPENSVSVGRDLYLINEDAAKFWEFRDKKEIEFRVNMNKWKILNEERDEFKNNIRSIIQ